ncbi:MAG: hypothetical protein HWE26_17965 [Alteromonadaceae bacterium]|nr:hypothetical protein [Alteromonadaceae bacterium]
MSKIIFLAGMPRSGTTLIQGQLCKIGCVCLGEVGQTIQSIRREKIKKSKLSPKNHWNNKKYDELEYNEFWQPLIPRINNADNVVKATEIVYQEAIRAYPDSILVDSSKHIGHLRNSLNGKYGSIVEVYHVIRDYKSWLRSIINYEKQYGLKKEKFSALRWFYVNKKLELFLKKNLVKSHTLYFEQLVLLDEFNDLEILTQISKFQRYDSIFFEMFGSFKNMDKINKGIIKYDARWIIDFNPPIYSFFLDRYLRTIKKKHFKN